MQHEIETAVIELLPLSNRQDSPVVALDDAELQQVVGGRGPNTGWAIVAGPNTGW